MSLLGCVAPASSTPPPPGTSAPPLVVASPSEATAPAIRNGTVEVARTGRVFPRHLVWNGSSLAVIYSDTRSSIDSDLLFAGVSAAGEVTIGRDLVSGAGGRLVYDGDGYGFAYSDYETQHEILFMRLDDTGKALTDPVKLTEHAADAPVIAWNPTAKTYSVLWTDWIDDGWHLHRAEVDAAGRKTRVDTPLSGEANDAGSFRRVRGPASAVASGHLFVALEPDARLVTLDGSKVVRESDLNLVARSYISDPIAIGEDIVVPASAPGGGEIVALRISRKGVQRWSSTIVKRDSRKMMAGAPALLSIDEERFIAVWQEHPPADPQARLWYAVYSAGDGSALRDPARLDAIEEPQLGSYLANVDGRVAVLYQVGNYNRNPRVHLKFLTL